MRLLPESGRVFLASGAAAPTPLIPALVAAPHLRQLEIVHILTLGDAPHIAPEHQGRIRHNALFIGPNVRSAVQEGRADYTPAFLSEIPELFSTSMPLDAAVIHTSPPDEQGMLNLGVSVDVVLAAVRTARHVIAQVNPRMPRVRGDAQVPLSRIAAIVEVESILHELHYKPIDVVSRRIGQHVAEMIADGDTLQMGIGAIPNAVLESLVDKRDLGVHTEMFSDGLLPLIERGVVTGARKTVGVGKVITSFVMGSKRVYDFVHENSLVEFYPSEHVNDPTVIAQHDRMVAINSALQVDLTGQVCADSIGYRFYSGIGGQVDFIRGAARSRGGKPIIALPSTAKGGAVSRIVPCLDQGAGVVTTRGDVHSIVTEYGVAQLHGRSVRERVRALIGIAHPDFRDWLFSEARRTGLL